MTLHEQMVLGILVSQQNLRSPYVRSVLETAKQNGLQATAVTATMLLEAKPTRLWPLPTVVYNRLPTRRDEASDAVKRAKIWARENNIPYFNERFLNKREIDEVLRESVDTASLLPNTVLRLNEKSVSDMLAEYQEIFIKPISGSFGEGICRMAQEGRAYRLQVREYDRINTYHFQHINECIRYCQSRFAIGPFIVQEAVSLLQYDDCKTDFRVHVHRLDLSHWRVAGIGAKVAQPDGITTHVHSGGRLEDADVVLRSWFGSDAPRVRHALESAAKTVSRRLAEQMDGWYAEFGLDMGISQNERIVLFEANAKPGRMIFSHPSLKSAGVKSREYVLSFASFLHPATQDLMVDAYQTGDGRDS